MKNMTSENHDQVKLEMTKEDRFLYYPETMSFSDYWEIAAAEAQQGRFIPFYLYSRAADFASKHFSILLEKERWDKSYTLRIKRLAFKWHKYKYNTFNKK